MEGDVVDPEAYEVTEGSWQSDQTIPSVIMPASRATQVGRAQRDTLRSYCSSSLDLVYRLVRPNINLFCGKGKDLIPWRFGLGIVINFLSPFPSVL